MHVDRCQGHDWCHADPDARWFNASIVLISARQGLADTGVVVSV